MERQTHMGIDGHVHREKDNAGSGDDGVQNVWLHIEAMVHKHIGGA